MISRDPKTAQKRMSKQEGKPDARLAGTGGDENCRCKEASRMTPRELLKLMINDLAFWKKTDEE